VIAALSRIGATGVLLRPDGDLVNEAGLGQVAWVISDPEHGSGAERVSGVRWGVLGTGSDRSELPDRVIDLELIDPDAVELPAWYRPNPQRAADTAFVVFTGEADTTRAVSISNGRWARSALGTASAAALRPGDTVYSVTPHHHSSALLMSVGGAVAGGARFAMASGTDPATFWAEVRRYGATHVSYTWASLREVTLAGEDPSERYHPIRMFMGSGMPANLWRRVVARFPTTQVLEFYASAEGHTILANLTGTPVGSLGSPLPGTAEVRIAAFDQVNRGLELGPDGLARECAPGEVGLLVARVSPDDPTAGTPLRGLFEPDDAWQSTDDLFRRDENGQLWLVESVAGLIDTAGGVVAPAVARRAVEAIPAVDLSVAYGVPVEAGPQALVVALTLRPGTELTGSELARACDRLPAAQRPDYVQVDPAHHLGTADLARPAGGRCAHPRTRPHGLAARRGPDRLPEGGAGQARVGQARVGQARVGQARVGQARVGQARVDQAESRVRPPSTARTWPVR
jgi:putative long chain acyl-CoA synthase